MQWTSKSSSRPQNVSSAKVQDKNDADHIFDKQGVIRIKFVPEGQIVDSAIYVEVIG
jgi:hypothetical protein